MRESDKHSVAIGGPDGENHGSMTDQQRLEQLLLAEHPCLTVQTVEEMDMLRLVAQAALETQREMVVWSSSQGVRDGLLAKSNPAAETEHPAGALYHLALSEHPRIIVMLDLAGHLKDERTLRLLRDLLERCRRTHSHLILVDHQHELPPAIRAAATPFELSLPDETELERIVKDTLRERHELYPIYVDINRRELETIIRNLRGLSARQARQVILDTISADHRLDVTDINTVLAEKRRQLQSIGLLEYVEAPVDLSEIGGLNRLKSWLRMRQEAFTKEAAEFGISPPRGVLMLGVQGAGKSLSAKAIATAWQRPLLRMDVGALYDKFIGESERRLRDALKQAEMMAPIVLWIDEIEKAFASAAAHSADGGLSQRMFGALLTWMQEHAEPVFLIATANDIEALPPELLRKGRFDEIFFVDLPNLDARAAIFQIHLAKRKRDPKGFDIAALAEASDGYSGAEIEQVVVAGLHQAFTARSDLTTEHLLDALKQSPPLSVTMAERVAALRLWAEGRCMRAD